MSARVLSQNTSKQAPIQRARPGQSLLCSFGPILVDEQTKNGSHHQNAKSEPISSLVRNQIMASIRQAVIILILSACHQTSWAQPVEVPKSVLLWPEGAPGALGNSASDQPRLTLFLSKEKVGRGSKTGVLVLPGGGYSGLSVDQEGFPSVKWLNSVGISAFLLAYRVGPRYHHPIELGDASRAMRWIRSHAAEFGVDPHRIGVWGFSAGGHLASTLGTHFDGGDSSAKDAISRSSDRPDFMILTYPVIGPWGKASEGSFANLLGDHPDPAVLEDLTNDKHVTAETPPTFLVHGNDDQWVWPENSINFYLALRRAGVPAELHIYQRGEHGFGLAESDPVLSSWTVLLANWLRLRGLLKTY
jgi:acetyl esterase/lipase